MRSLRSLSSSMAAVLVRRGRHGDKTAGRDVGRRPPSASPGQAGTGSPSAPSEGSDPAVPLVSDFWPQSCGTGHVWGPLFGQPEGTGMAAFSEVRGQPCAFAFTLGPQELRTVEARSGQQRPVSGGR